MKRAAWRKTRVTALRYGLAGGLSAGALGVCVALQLWSKDEFYFPLLVAVMVASLRGGLGPGLFACFVAVVGVHAIGADLVDRGQQAPWIIFLFAGTSLLTAWVGTSARRARSSAETARAQLHAVLQSMPHGVIAIRAPDGAPLFSNSRADEIFGPATLAASSQRPLQRALETGARVPAEEIAFTQPDGSTRIAEWNTGPIRDQRGHLLGAVTVFSDVTDRVERETRARLLARATEAIHSSFDFREAVPEMARMVVPVLADWCLIDVFEESGETTRLAIAHSDPAREQLGWDIYDRHQGDIYLSKFGRGVLARGEPLLLEEITEATVRALAINEEHMEALRAFQACSIAILPLATRGKSIGSLVLVMSESDRHFRDADLDFLKEFARRISLAIDNARLYALAQQAIRARDDFLSMASHDLGTPLTTIRLQTQFLLRKASLEPHGPSTLGADLERLDRQVARMFTMLSLLMDVSRIHNDRLALERTETNLTDLVRDLVRAMEPIFSQAGCVAVLEGEEGILGSWDRLRLEQLVTNLLTNAAKYGAGKPIEIFVDQTAQGARLRVRDHGAGIPPEQQRRLFKRFERVGDKKAFSGTGLGLWISRQIVEGHGGSIDVDSQVGEGTTFTVILPPTSAGDRSV